MTAELVTSANPQSILIKFAMIDVSNCPVFHNAAAQSDVSLLSNLTISKFIPDMSTLCFLARKSTFSSFLVRKKKQEL